MGGKLWYILVGYHLILPLSLLSFYLVVEADLRYASVEASPHFSTRSF